MSPDRPDRPWFDARAAAAAEPLLELLKTSHVSLSSVTDPREARDVHVADSLSGLAVPELREASSVADIGAGAGFPGLLLALALPEARVDLIESVGRKAEFIAQAAEAVGAANARSVNARSEDWAAGEGWERYDAVTARAVADLVVLAELASPLLGTGGCLVAWKGAREPEREEALRRAEARTAMRHDRVVSVVPFSGSRKRHLHVIRKTGPTPAGLPRRPGVARKKPLA